MSRELAEHVKDLLSSLGPVEAKRMFGGHGIYLHGTMFALIADDVLFLRTDAATAPAFAALGLPPFRYDRAGRVIVMAYHQAPEDFLEDRAVAARWARQAYDAALRVRASKRVRQPERSPR
jgi:DNA transformation protein